jgi:hypothetical protein
MARVRPVRSERIVTGAFCDTSPEGIIEQLTWVKPHVFPYNAVRAALARPERVADRLLAELSLTPEQLDEATSEERPDGSTNWLHTFAIYLLAQWQDRRAFAPIVDFFSSPGELGSNLTGDLVTEDLNAILTRLYDGDLGRLEGLIESEAAYEFARGAAIDALGLLIHAGKIDEATVVEYLGGLLDSAGSESNPLVLAMLSDLAADLRHPSLLPKVRRCFDDDIIDVTYTGWEYLKENFALPAEEAAKKFEELAALPDVIDNLSACPYFRPRQPRRAIQNIGYWRTKVRAQQAGTYRREDSKLSRNDPCPCGSGAKYKKCCLTAEAA